MDTIYSTNQLVAVAEQTTSVSGSVSTSVIILTGITVGVFLLILLVWLQIDYRRHKKPLVSVDPNVGYTFFHHVRMVTLPLLSYRITFMLQKRDK